MIPEWKDQYVALEALLKQIESIKNAAIRLVQSIANIKSTTTISSSLHISAAYANQFRFLHLIELEGGPTVEVDLHEIRVRPFSSLSRIALSFHC